MNGMYMDPPPAWLDTSSFLTCHSYIDRKQKQQINKVSSRDHEHPITRHLECDHLMSSSSAFTFFWPSDEIICLRFDSSNETSKFQASSQKHKPALSLSLSLTLKSSLSLSLRTFHQFLASLYYGLEFIEESEGISIFFFSSLISLLASWIKPAPTRIALC
jgi:hypothetical protein